MREGMEGRHMEKKKVEDEQEEEERKTQTRLGRNHWEKACYVRQNGGHKKSSNLEYRCPLHSWRLADFLPWPNMPTFFQTCWLILITYRKSNHFKKCIHDATRGICKKTWIESGFLGLVTTVRGSVISDNNCHKNTPAEAFHLICARSGWRHSSFGRNAELCITPGAVSGCQVSFGWGVKILTEAVI